MDGDVLTVAFIDDVRETRIIIRRPLEQLVDMATAQANRDTDVVEDRLENLGYI